MKLEIEDETIAKEIAAQATRTLCGSLSREDYRGWQRSSRRLKKIKND